MTTRLRRTGTSGCPSNAPPDRRPHPDRSPENAWGRQLAGPVAFSSSAKTTSSSRPSSSRPSCWSSWRPSSASQPYEPPRVGTIRRPLCRSGVMRRSRSFSPAPGLTSPRQTRRAGPSSRTREVRPVPSVGSDPRLRSRRSGRGNFSLMVGAVSRSPRGSTGRRALGARSAPRYT